MPPTIRPIDRRVSQRIAREFVSTLATLGLLEYVRRFESVVLAGEGSALLRTFVSTTWSRAFGNVVKHDVLSSIAEHGVESLDLTALDEAGRPLLRQTFQVTPDDRLMLVVGRRWPDPTS